MEPSSLASSPILPCYVESYSGARISMTNTGRAGLKASWACAPQRGRREVSGDSKALTGEEFNKITGLLSNRGSLQASGP